VQSNSFVNNTDLAIDLAGNGVTLNDAGDIDAGPNNLQNFPVITDATTTSVTGTFNGAADTTFQLQLFTTVTCDPSQHGEGETLVLPFSVTTNTNGSASFVQDVVLPAGQWATATATDPSGNTSEFSSCKLVSVSGTDPAGDAGAGNPDLVSASGEVSLW
jgi:hypothetical protein